MKGTVMMFIGGLIMGIALEHSNLHRRLALKIIIFFGSSYKKYKLVKKILFFITIHLSILKSDDRYHVGNIFSVNGEECHYFIKWSNIDYLQWINNTATTAMMIPIVDSILEEMSKFSCTL